MEWSAEALRERFDANEPFTVGLEEEALLVDATSGRLAPVAEQVVASAGSPAIKTELPACQVEVLTTPNRRSPPRRRSRRSSRPLSST